MIEDESDEDSEPEEKRPQRANFREEIDEVDDDTMSRKLKAVPLVGGALSSVSDAGVSLVGFVGKSLKTAGRGVQSVGKSVVGGVSSGIDEVKRAGTKFTELGSKLAATIEGADEEVQEEEDEAPPPRRRRRHVEEDQVPARSRSVTKPDRSSDRKRGEDVASAVNESRRLAQRNLERMEEMEDRSQDVHDESQSFADLAKQLKDKQRSKSKSRLFS